MYKLEPIVSFGDNLSLPTCMYEVANIHGRSVCLDVATYDPVRGTNSIVIQQKPSTVYKMIEERQKKLLQQLESLRSQMRAMKQNILSTSQHSNILPLGHCEKQKLPNDIVINADPKHPPFYLLSLQKLLSLKISCHTHSSIVNLPTPALEFINRANVGNPSSQNLSLVLIWKLVGVGTKLMTCSTMPVVICGDVNIVRYVTSAVPSNLSYQHLDNSWEIDSILDLCHKLQWCKTVKDKQSLLHQLNSKLGKNQWLNNDSPNYTIGDVAAWNVIKQEESMAALPTNLKGWYKKCDSIF